jgi:hypothetical protein
MNRVKELNEFMEIYCEGENKICKKGCRFYDSDGCKHPKHPENKGTIYEGKLPF